MHAHRFAHNASTDPADFLHDSLLIVLVQFLGYIQLVIDVTPVHSFITRIMFVMPLFHMGSGWPIVITKISPVNTSPVANAELAALAIISSVFCGSDVRHGRHPQKRESFLSVFSSGDKAMIGWLGRKREMYSAVSPDRVCTTMAAAFR